MKKRNPARALLTEIVLVVLFCAVATAVIARLFSAAQHQSHQADLELRALTLSQNLADRIYAAEDAEALLASQGFEKNGDGYSLQSEELLILVTCTEQKTDHGLYRDAEVSVRSGDEILISLPCPRYFQGVSP